MRQRLHYRWPCEGGRDQGLTVFLGSGLCRNLASSVSALLVNLAMFFSYVWRLFLPKIKSTFVLKARKAAASALAWLTHSSSLVFWDAVEGPSDSPLLHQPNWPPGASGFPKNPWSLHRQPGLSPDRNRWRDFPNCRGYLLGVLYFVAHLPYSVYYSRCLPLACFGLLQVLYFHGTSTEN